MKQRKAKKLWRKIVREVGFTGNGPTLFDRPSPAMGRKERRFVRRYKLLEFEAERRQSVFRQACIATLGEDPNDW